VIGIIFPVIFTDDEPNLAKGEIEKFSYVESQKLTHKVGDRVNRTMWDDKKNEFGTIWVCLGNDYFKQIGRWPERNC
jgi:hypothetical protein